ncbi:MAG: alpha/beta fold hydrolase [Paracoccus sp. (in: a-proteobacteria)]|nr:alpha/beta fold hydrolase [Paracoccus sp. (in: a-proteobacteria)]
MGFRSHPLPFLWPLAAAGAAGATSWDIFERNLRFFDKAIEDDHPPPPDWTTPNRVILELDSMRLRDFSGVGSGGVPVLIDAPYAGHSATIADFGPGQSLVATLLANGLGRVLVTDWKPATPEMRDFDIDTYLSEINVVVDDLGGRVALVGLCQGGWMSAMYAARFPGKVAALVLAGSPIDTHAGSGPIKRLAHGLGPDFYADMVAANGGLMPGRLMLSGWKSMHPERQYFQKYVDLYEHLDDADYVARAEHFARWYENALDLPGRYYLQAINDLFIDNRFARGEFVGLGRKLSLSEITCPAYLLAGTEDDITPAAQVFAARRLLGTPPEQITAQTVPGGHIGLFMGSGTLRNAWPDIAHWLTDRVRG